MGEGTSIDRGRNEVLEVRGNMADRLGGHQSIM